MRNEVYVTYPPVRIVTHSSCSPSVEGIIGTVTLYKPPGYFGSVVFSTDFTVNVSPDAITEGLQKRKKYKNKPFQHFQGGGNAECDTQQTRIKCFAGSRLIRLQRSNPEQLEQVWIHHSNMIQLGGLILKDI